MLEGRQIKVGVLGATGTVGQRFISLLGDHPFFVVHALGASPRSAGKPYERVVSWKLSTPIPIHVRGIVVQECDPQNFAECVVVFSGLDADVAGDIGTPLLNSTLSRIKLTRMVQRRRLELLNLPCSPIRKTIDGIRTFHCSSPL